MFGLHSFVLKTSINETHSFLGHSKTARLKTCIKCLTVYAKCTVNFKPAENYNERQRNQGRLFYLHGFSDKWSLFHALDAVNVSEM